MPFSLRYLTRGFLAVGAATALFGTLAPRLGLAAAVPFHLRLVKSEPAKGDTVAPPAVLRLWFSEPATLAVTSVTLKGSDGKDVMLGKIRFSGDAKQPVEAPVAGAVTKGTYTVSYKAASRDMHPITGGFSFTVR